MQPDYLLRCSRIESQFELLAADGFLITNLTNVRYLSGFTGSNAALLMSPKNSTLITDGRYRDQAAAQSPQVALEINRNCPTAGIQLAEAQGRPVLQLQLLLRHIHAGDLGDHQRHAGPIAEAAEVNGNFRAFVVAGDQAGNHPGIER